MKVTRMFAAAKKDSELELLIYDAIGADYWGGGVTAAKVQQQLKDAGDVSKIKLRINSPGGDVFEGSAIYSLLSQHSAEVECFIDGLCASAAFTIAMAADKIHISESAMMMCHNAWGMCVGYAEDMNKTADVLQKISSTMCDIYAKRCGMSSEEVQKLMDDETWMTASEAVDYGFADDVVARDAGEDEDAQALAASFDLKKFAKKGPKSSNRPEEAPPNPAATADPADGDGCECDCPECEAGNCENCSNTECDDSNCENCPNQEAAAAAAAFAENEMLLDELELLSL